MKSNKRWFSIKNTLPSASRKPKMALCGDNGGIWRFILKYSITVHHNHLVLEQWRKRWTTVASSKLQNEQNGVLCLRNKKKLLIKIQSIVYNFVLKTSQLRIYCGNTWKNINMFPLQSQISKHTLKILFVRLVWLFHVEVISNKAFSQLAFQNNVFDWIL